MSIIAQVGNAQAGRPNRRAPQPIVQCLHERMERLYGSWRCDLCHYPSPLNWVYQCALDDSTLGDFSFLKSLKHPVGPFGEKLRQMGFSESIVKQWEEGLYTDEQIQILVRQKQNMQQIISSVNEQRCRFKVCHQCRPVFRERCWMSFDAVFEDEIPPVDQYELEEGLPVRDARIVRGLGRRLPLPLFSLRRPTGSPNSSAGESPDSDFSSDDFSIDDPSDEERYERRIDDSWAEGRGGEGCSPTFVDQREVRRAETPQSTIRLVPQSSVPRRLRRVSGSIVDCSPARSHATSSSISLPTIPTTTSFTTLPDFEDEVQKLQAHFLNKSSTDPASNSELRGV